MEGDLKERPDIRSQCTNLLEKRVGVGQRPGVFQLEQSQP